MFVKIPHLPCSRVKCVIVDRNAPEQLFSYLKSNKISYIKSAYIDNCIESVSTHPDMQICHLGDDLYVCEPSIYEYYKNHMNLYGVNIASGDKNIQSNYPHDIAYNVVITRNFLLHNTEYTEGKILKYAKTHNLSIYKTKQGYTKCATCIIGDNAIITSDNGLYNVYKGIGVDCLLIENDRINMGNREDGFIGGCCGMIDKDTLLFCGDIKRHKSYSLIKAFADKHNVRLVSAYDGILTDVGSIIPVIQE